MSESANAVFSVLDEEWAWSDRAEQLEQAIKDHERGLLTDAELYAIAHGECRGAYSDGQ